MRTREYFISSSKFLKLDIKVEYKNILQEAINLKSKFIYHKPRPYFHQGWKSLSLHSISQTHIETWGDYGFKNAEEMGVSSVWTDISKECPHTMNFLLNNFPSKDFGQVRFELLEPDGVVDERQSRVPALETIIIPLNNPVGSALIWDDGQEYVFSPGSVITLNTHYFHKLVNNSDEDRYQLIINRRDSTNEWKSLIDTACNEQQVEGEYITHNIAVF